MTHVEEVSSSRNAEETGAATLKGAAGDLHIVNGEVRGRTFDIVTLRADGSVDTYVACDVVKEYARRFAAAPELLAMLINLVELCDDVFVKPAECVDLIAAKAAIAKASDR